MLFSFLYIRIYRDITNDKIFVLMRAIKQPLSAITATLLQTMYFFPLPMIIICVQIQSALYKTNFKTYKTKTPHHEY